MFMQHMTVDEFKKKLESIYRSAQSPSQFYSILDNIKDIILRYLIREYEEGMQSKDIWSNLQAYDRSFSFPEILGHDKYAEKAHAYAAKKLPNVSDKDELTLAQAQKIGGVEWPRWV